MHQITGTPKHEQEQDKQHHDLKQECYSNTSIREERQKIYVLRNKQYTLS